MDRKRRAPDTEPMTIMTHDKKRNQEEERRACKPGSKSRRQPKTAMTIPSTSMSRCMSLPSINWHTNYYYYCFYYYYYYLLFIITSIVVVVVVIIIIIIVVVVVTIIIIVKTIIVIVNH